MCYPSLCISLHQPNPRESPCAPSTYPERGYSGGPPLCHPPLPVPDPIPGEPSPCSQSGHSPHPPAATSWLSCISCYSLSPRWVPGSVVGILRGLSHVIPHLPPGSGGATIIIPTLQMKKLRGAQACFWLPSQEREVGEPELSVLP